MIEASTVPNEPPTPTCLGLPFVGRRPLTDFERRRGERRLAGRRFLWVSRPAALGVAGVILLSWLFPEAQLDFYRDVGLSLLALGGVACLGGALVAFRKLGKEVTSLRLDLADGQVERYERRREADSGAVVVGQASILPRSRLEVGLGGRHLRVEPAPPARSAGSEKALLIPSRQPIPPLGESRPSTEPEIAEIDQLRRNLLQHLSRQAFGTIVLLFATYLSRSWTLAIVWIVTTLPGWLQRFLAARRLRADRRAGVILRGRSEEEAGLPWEILACSRFLWTEKGQPARWRSEREGDASARSVPVSIWYRDLFPRFESRDAIPKLSRPIQDAIGSPRALGAVVPIGFLALLIWGLLTMPPIPTTSQVLAPFAWAVAAILSFAYLLAVLQGSSEDLTLRPADTREASRPRAEEPKPQSGEIRRRALQPSERDRVARLASKHSEGFWLTLAFPVLGGLMAMRSELSDRGWFLALALFVAWMPFWMSGLHNAWAAFQLRRDLRDGTVIVGPSASESGEIEWLARSRFAWTEDGEPVAWRGE